MVNEFLDYLQYEKNYSTHTVFAYKADIENFCAFVFNAESNFDFSSVKAIQIQHWVLSMMNEGLSARSVGRKLSSVKSFWHYLLIMRYVDHNPVQKIILPKTKRPLPVFFKDKEVFQVLEKDLVLNHFEDVRDRLILSLFYQTGVRLSELVNIKDKDVDYYLKQIRVLGKRNKERFLPLSDELIKEIEDYCKVRDVQVDVVCDKLFVRNNGEAVYAKLVYRVVCSNMAQVTSQNKRSPHVFRHTFATSLLNNGAEINSVKELLGHSSLAATQVYTHTTFEELKKIYNNAHPRAK